MFFSSTLEGESELCNWLGHSFPKMTHVLKNNAADLVKQMEKTVKDNQRNDLWGTSSDTCSDSGKLSADGKIPHRFCKKSQQT